MAPDVTSKDAPRKWPPKEYYDVKRPIEEWVPPLKDLEQMEMDEPERFGNRLKHEPLCLALYRQGKTREEVFQLLGGNPRKAGRDSSMEERDRELMERYGARLGMCPSLERREMLQKQSAGGFKRLEGTSQGCRFDVPPTEWIVEELVKFGARSKPTINITCFYETDESLGPQGTTRVPDLQGEIHSALQQNRWPGMAQNRYDALRQSVLFASNLLHLSGAALASFFPVALAHSQRNVGQARRRRIIAGPVDDNRPFTEEMYAPLGIAQQYFESLAPSITWVESPTILSKNGWFGINGSGMGEPEERGDEWDWMAARDRDEAAGHESRQVEIAIASEFIDAIMTSKPDSEQHLFATFYAGVNIAHELAHFWALHRYTTVPDPASGEPFFGNSLNMELGDAYISWLFGGFIPHPIGNGTNECFDQGMYWRRAHVVGMTDSGYDIGYSMAISDIERMLSHTSWTKYGFAGNNPADSRRVLLHPRLPFRVTEAARIVKWRNLALSKRGLTFDVRGLAEKGDAGFVDYSLCPLAFCDLDWDDISTTNEAANAKGPPGHISDLSAGTDKMRIKVLEREKASLQTSLASTDDELCNLAPERTRERNVLNDIEERPQNWERYEGGPSSGSQPSKRAKLNQEVVFIEDDHEIIVIEDDPPDFQCEKNKLTPLPAAARLFFPLDMPKGERQKLENKLRLFHHKKQLGTGDEDEYDSDDAAEFDTDDPYGQIEVGDRRTGPFGKSG